ncbi:hypothetical protein BY458DRAFT_503462 [Sporodiniella umbellata]|nr:hypothetical protein BY458DRAFT_503462 [Sporodiniella umbellata]
MQSIQSYISYTRISTFTLSILIVISSLCIYNFRSIPVYSLIDTSAQQEGERMVNELIQDRRLIATLVASQASIFCPLFLLMNLHTEERAPCAAVLLEQFFQCLMPIGLVISWCFCIGFDQNVKTVLSLDEHWLTDGLKYLVVFTLALEILLIWSESFYYLWLIQREGTIHLPDEEECLLSEKQ